jgi:hypothetical protein
MLIRFFAPMLFLICLVPPAASQQTERDLSVCRDNLTRTLSQYERVQAELDRRQQELTNCTDQLKRAEADLQQCRQERLLLPTEREALQKEVARLQDDKLALEAEIEARKREESNFVAGIEGLRGVRGAFQNPDLPGRANRLFDLLRSDQRPKTVSYIEEGRRYVITNVVLGTLKLSYGGEIKPGKPESVKLEFQPHAVLRDDLLGAFLPDQVMTRWHVKAQYRPTQIFAQYDVSQSGQKPEERILDLRNNNKETWVWTVNPRTGFQRDSTDLIFYLGYSADYRPQVESDVQHESIVWVEKREPGWLSWLWTQIIGFPKVMVAVLVTLTAIIASVLTIIVRGLELKKKIS